jgi:hypothetical protein
MSKIAEYSSHWEKSNKQRVKLSSLKNTIIKKVSYQ